MQHAGRSPSHPTCIDRATLYLSYYACTSTKELETRGLQCSVHPRQIWMHFHYQQVDEVQTSSKPDYYPTRLASSSI